MSGMVTVRGLKAADVLDRLSAVARAELNRQFSRYAEAIGDTTTEKHITVRDVVLTNHIARVLKGEPDVQHHWFIPTPKGSDAKSDKIAIQYNPHENVADLQPSGVAAILGRSYSLRSSGPALGSALKFT